MKNQFSIRPKRIYDDCDDQDGYRVLVDRLWPRGVSKEDAQLNYWLKEIAPSGDLRKWFNHDASRFDEFKQRYRDELSQKEELINFIIELASQRTVTLLYAAKDRTYNNAIVLKEYLENKVEQS